MTVALLIIKKTARIRYSQLQKGDWIMCRILAGREERATEHQRYLGIDAEDRRLARI